MVTPAMVAAAELLTPLVQGATAATAVFRAAVVAVAEREPVPSQAPVVMAVVATPK